MKGIKTKKPKASLNKMLHVEKNPSGLCRLVDTDGNVVTVADMGIKNYYGLFYPLTGKLVYIETSPSTGLHLRSIREGETSTTVTPKDLENWQGFYQDNKDKLPAVSNAWDKKIARNLIKESERSETTAEAPAKNTEPLAKHKCVRVYRTKEPGKPERITHFEIQKANGNTVSPTRADIDKVYRNPAPQDTENLTDAYKTDEVIEGIRYEKWIPKGKPKATWHLRVATNIEQVIGYGEDVKYLCTDVWKEQSAGGSFGRTIKYRLVNDVTKEESYVTRNEIWELIKNPYALEGKNGSDEYLTDKVTGLRVDFYRDPSTGKGSWRLRTAATVAVHGQDELKSVAQTSLDKAETIKCTKAYRVQMPVKVEGTKPRTLYIKYELVTPDGSTYEKNTKEILDMMTQIGKMGREEKSAEKFVGLTIQWVSYDGSWRLRLSKKDTPEIIDIPYEEYSKDHTINEAKLEKSDEIARQQKSYDKRDECRKNGGLVIRVVYRLRTEKGKCVKFLVVSPGTMNEVKEYSRDSLERFIGEPNEENEQRAKKLLYGVILRVGDNGNWTVLVANKEPERPETRVVNESGELDYQVALLEEFDNSEDWDTEELLKQKDGRKFFRVEEVNKLLIPLERLTDLRNEQVTFLKMLGFLFDPDDTLKLSQGKYLDFYLLAPDGSNMVSSVLFEKEQTGPQGIIKVYLLHRKVSNSANLEEEATKYPDTDIFGLEFNSNTPLYAGGQGVECLEVTGILIGIRVLKGLIKQIYEASGLQVKAIRYCKTNTVQSHTIVCMNKLQGIPNLLLAGAENIYLGYYKYLAAVKATQEFKELDILPPLVLDVKEDIGINVGEKNVRIQVIFERLIDNCHAYIYILGNKSEAYTKELSKGFTRIKTPISEYLSFDSYKVLSLRKYSQDLAEASVSKYFNTKQDFLEWYATVLVTGEDTRDLSLEEQPNPGKEDESTTDTKKILLHDYSRRFSSTVGAMLSDYNIIVSNSQGTECKCKGVRLEDIDANTTRKGFENPITSILTPNFVRGQDNEAIGTKKGFASPVASVLTPKEDGYISVYRIEIDKNGSKAKSKSLDLMINVWGGYKKLEVAIKATGNTKLSIERYLQDTVARPSYYSLDLKLSDEETQEFPSATALLQVILGILQRDFGAMLTSLAPIGDITEEVRGSFIDRLSDDKSLTLELRHRK